MGGGRGDLQNSQEVGGMICKSPTSSERPVESVSCDSD
jgi:hypothetical protein